MTTTLKKLIGTLAIGIGITFSATQCASSASPSTDPLLDPSYNSIAFCLDQHWYSLYEMKDSLDTIYRDAGSYLWAAVQAYAHNSDPWTAVDNALLARAEFDKFKELWTEYDRRYREFQGIAPTFGSPATATTASDLTVALTDGPNTADDVFRLSTIWIYGIEAFGLSQEPSNSDQYQP